MTTNNCINTERQVIQFVSTSSASVLTSTNSIPNDNSIPQNTEGDEIMTLSITPMLSTSKLLIFFSCQIISANPPVVALFQDSTANALAAIGFRSNSRNNAQIVHMMTSGTTSSTTFKIRMGAGANVYINADGSGNRLMGGVSRAWLTITEFYS